MTAFVSTSSAPTSSAPTAAVGRSIVSGDWPASALRAADAAFTALTCDPDPLTLDCDTLTASSTADDPARGGRLGLPAGEVPLRDLRDWMLAHPKRYAARDAIWRELVLRARLGEAAWVVAAVGMAMPALIPCAGRLAAGYRGDPNDLDAEVLTGFLEALRGRLDLTRPGLYARLCWAAYRAGRAARRADDGYLLLDDLDTAVGSRTPQLPYGHPTCSCNAPPRCNSSTTTTPNCSSTSVSLTAPSNLSRRPAASPLTRCAAAWSGPPPASPTPSPQESSPQRSPPKPPKRSPAKPNTAPRSAPPSASPTQRETTQRSASQATSGATAV
jgi:hypothetical protein